MLAYLHTQEPDEALVVDEGGHPGRRGAELLVELETVPWNGDSLHKDNPDGAVRSDAVAW